MSERETSASLEIAAPPERVYDLVSDVTRMGEYSPECQRGEWLGAAGPAVGARFRGRNRHGMYRWSTTCRVVAAERGREFAWEVTAALGLPVARWGYRFEPSGAGTRVTEEWVDRRSGLVRTLGRLTTGTPHDAAQTRESMRQTLERLRVVAEGTAAA